MPDGSVVDWDYATATKIAKLLTVDKNGKDAHGSVVRPGEHRPVRASSRSATTSARSAPTGRRAQLAGGADGKTAQIPAAWAEAWKWFYEGIWTDHISMTGPQFLGKDTNPDGLPVLHGQRRDERELPVVHLRRGRSPGTTGTWPPPRPTTGQTTAALQCGHVPHPQVQQAPGRGVHGADLPPGRRLEAAPASVRRHARSGRGPGRLLHRRPRRAYTQTIDWQVAKDGIAYADVPNFEGYMPAYNESLDLIITFGTKWQATPGLDHGQGDPGPAEPAPGHLGQGGLTAHP